MIVVPVPLPGDRHYDVLVGAEARHRLPELIAALVPTARRVAVVTQAPIVEATDGLADLTTGLPTRHSLIGEGEEHKSLATVEEVCRSWAQWGLTRNDVVVCLGGGMVTDVGGFAAAVYHRGLPVLHVPTTLLGMIDAAIGGKTGVNLAEGKNLVGAFWQPAAVVCDTELLDTLPAREYRSGLGEMAKYHFLGNPGGTEELDRLPLAERVARCVQIKADVVASDEREGGRRAILNYGHTLAHALEIAEQFDLRHGEAVAVGLVFAAELAARLGRVDEGRVAEHRRIVGGYDLPTRLPAGVDADELVALMGRDKKALDGLTFVLDGRDGVETVGGVARALIDDALDAVR